MNKADQERLDGAIRSLADAQKSLKSIGLEVPSEPLAIENARLRERVALLERERLGEETEEEKNASGQNAATLSRNTAVAVREFVGQVFEDGRHQDISDELLIAWVRGAISRMAFRRVVVAILYFGLDGLGPRSLSQVARALGRSVANIGQARDRVLREMRGWANLQSLRDLCGGTPG
jgi:hypothetical protein